MPTAPTAMPKPRPATPISQSSSFSCALPPPPPPQQQQLQPEPQPSEPHFTPGSQHPATPPEEEEDPLASKLAEPLRTTPPSVSAFFSTINSFLEGDCYHEQSLVLTRVSPSRLVRFQRWALKRNRRFRYTYDAPLRTLTLRGMITAVHDALSTWVTEIYADLRAVLSAEERSHVVLCFSRDVELQGGSVRQPDAAFFYARVAAADGQWRRDPFPRVVFEVAFKQRYNEVVEAAKVWLTRSEDKVEVVVVVNIEEGAILIGGAEAASGTAPHQGEEGGGGGEDEDGDEDEDELGREQVESQRSPSPLLLQEFHDTCDPSQWVGPLTATVELFRLTSGNEVVRDGPKYDILPRTSAAEPKPALRISDLLRGLADDGRTVPLPLEPYRRALDMAVRDLALARRAAVHRTRKRARGEEAGVDGEEFAIVGNERVEEEEGRDTKRVRVLRSGVGGAGN